MAILPAKNPDEELKYQRESQALITELSSRLTDICNDKIDENINYVLEKTGSFVDVDRSYVFAFSKDGRTASITHEWCADCMQPQIHRLQNFQVDHDGWWMKRLTELEEVCVPNVSSLPNEVGYFKDTLLAQSIKAVIILPIARDEKLIGFLGFDSVRRERIWKIGEIHLLKSLGKLLADVLSYNK